MKTQFMLSCILGFVIFISSSGHSTENSPSNIPYSLEDLEPSTDVITEVHETLDAILSMPQDLQTFENTLQPWLRLSTKINTYYDLLHSLAGEPSIENTAALNTLHDLRNIFIDISQNYHLKKVLSSCAKKTISSYESSPLQRNIANRFLKNTMEPFSNIPGSALAKNSEDHNFTVLNLQFAALTKNQKAILFQDILSANADLVCIREIYEDEAIEVYDFLQGNYAYFLHVDTLNPNFSTCSSGMLIASKYRFEKPQLSYFQESVYRDHEGLFDFIIKDEAGPLGHIYVVDLPKEAVEVQNQRIKCIVEKMQETILQRKEPIPVFICGDFTRLSSCEESKMFLNSYFRSGRNSIDALLLETLPTLPSELVNPSYSISTTPFFLSERHVGSLSFLKQENSFFTNNIFEKFGSHYDDCTILSSGQAEGV